MCVYCNFWWKRARTSGCLAKMRFSGKKRTFALPPPPCASASSEGMCPMPRSRRRSSGVPPPRPSRHPPLCEPGGGRGHGGRCGSGAHARGVVDQRDGIQGRAQTSSRVCLSMVANIRRGSMRLAPNATWATLRRRRRRPCPTTVVDASKAHARFPSVLRWHGFLKASSRRSRSTEDYLNSSELLQRHRCKRR